MGRVAVASSEVLLRASITYENPILFEERGSAVLVSLFGCVYRLKIKCPVGAIEQDIYCGTGTAQQQQGRTYEVYSLLQRPARLVSIQEYMRKETELCSTLCTSECHSFATE